MRGNPWCVHDIATESLRRLPRHAAARRRRNECDASDHLLPLELHRRRMGRAADGRTDDVVNPATGERDRRGGVVGRRRRRPRRRRRRRRRSTTGPASTPAARAARPAALRRRGRGRRRRPGRRSRAATSASPSSIIALEIEFLVDNLRFFAAGAPACSSTQAPGEYLDGLHVACCAATRSAWPRLIAPWNYPLKMAGWKLGPALAAGNTWC